MIAEERIRTLLEAAAADFTPPEDGPARVVDSAAPARPRRRRPGAGKLALAAAAAIVVVAAGITVVDRGDFEATSRAGGPPVPGLGDESDDTLSRTPQSAAGTRSGTAGGGSAGDASSDGGSPLAAAQVDLAKIIKTGSIVLEVDEGRFDDAVNRITALAAGAGGYVSGTNTATTFDGHQAGTMTIRVPAERFESVLEEVDRLGEVQRKEVTGRDVTAEYTDIDARLRALSASRESLLRVLSEAQAVGDILAVQDRLNSVQTEIEQLEGRKRVLDDQVGFSTVAISVSEPGESELLRTENDESVWRQALDGFTGTMAAVVAKSGTATALVLLGAGLLALVAVAVRWGRRAYARLAT